jgi:hypothetical protein
LELAEGKGVSTVLEAKSYLGRYENLSNGCVLGSNDCVVGALVRSLVFKKLENCLEKSLV